jgi:murein DD-endopeptidase MepM/ murein hydrolase activator NlpD
MVDKDGRISIAKIQANDPEAAAKLNAKDAKGEGLTEKNFNTRLNNLDPEQMEKLFTVQSFDSHKAARKSVRDVVNADIPWYKSFKRRAIRKDIANMTGIKSWRLFETSRDKLAKNKQDIKDRLLNKIVDKYYSNNPSSAQFMKCIFSNGRCANGSDPANPDEHVVDPAHGSAPDELADADVNPDTKDALGQKIKGEPLATGEAGTEAKKAIEGVISTEAAQETEKVASKFTLRQKLVLAIVRTMTGGTVSDAIPFNPTKVWTYAKRIAKVHGMIGSVAGASKLMNMVSNARSSQLQGIYATFQIASDQMKSGKLDSAELNDFFDQTKNIGNTEGWSAVDGQLKTTTVSADAVTNLDKKTFCDPTHKRIPNEFAWFCDSEKPNGGGNATTITEAYNSTVGPIAAPIADGVGAVQDSPIGTVVDWVSNTIDGVIGKVVDPAVQAIMDNTAFGKTVSDFMGVALSKMLEFLGASPLFAGDNPGLGNFLVAGGAASAEGSTRSSGGIKSTPKSLSYSNKLAADYKKDQLNKQSVVERYASLDNPDSLASSTLFAVASNLNSSQLITRLGSALSNLPATLGSIVSGRVFAADTPKPASAVADWAGVNKYDIPQACLDLDPLDPDYLSKSSNVSTIGLSPQTLGFDVMKDGDQFWKAVYDKLGDSGDAQAQAEKIYNCALFDNRAMGSLGYTYGYDKDGGYPDGGSQAGDATAAAQTGPTGGPLSWPENPTNSISQCFGGPAGGPPTGHPGVDMFAGEGTPIFAAQDGTVVAAYDSGPTNYGPNYVVIEGTNGIGTSYGHMSKMLVTQGAKVKQGDKIGEEGNLGLSRGSHLHFNVFHTPWARNDSQNIDPFKNGLTKPATAKGTSCPTS